MSGSTNSVAGATSSPEAITRYPLYGREDAITGSIDNDLRLRDEHGRFVEANRDYRRSLLAACQIVAAKRQ